MNADPAINLLYKSTTSHQCNSYMKMAVMMYSAIIFELLHSHIAVALVWEVMDL